MMFASRLLLILVSGFGTLAGAQLTFGHLQTGEVCPELGPIPACYLVLGAYALILISALLIKRAYASRLFFPGWLVVFGLAASGVTLELMVGDTCPAGPADIPQCFFSFLMASLCLIFFAVAKGWVLGGSSVPKQSGSDDV